MTVKTSVVRGPKDVVVKTRAWTLSMTTGTLVATLPKGSRLLRLEVGGVASNDSGTATLSVGTTTTATELAAALSVKTTSGVGPTSFPLVSGKYGTVFTVDTPIYLAYAGQNSDATLGGGYVSIYYTQSNIVNNDA